MKISILLLLLGVATATPALAVDLNLLGGIGFGIVRAHGQGAGYSGTPKPKFVGGAELNYAWAPEWSVEFGAFYAMNKFGTDNSQIERTAGLHLPLILRHWFGKNFSVGVGPFLVVSVGQVAISPTKDGVEGLEVSKNYKDTARWEQDYGAVAGLKAVWPVVIGLNGVFDARFYYGLRNLYAGFLPDTERGLDYSQRFSAIQFMTGVQFSY